MAMEGIISVCELGHHHQQTPPPPSLPPSKMCPSSRKPRNTLVNKYLVIPLLCPFLDLRHININKYIYVITYNFMNITKL